LKFFKKITELYSEFFVRKKPLTARRKAFKYNQKASDRLAKIFILPQLAAPDVLLKFFAKLGLSFC
jgi:hypothetical protein